MKAPWHRYVTGTLKVIATIILAIFAIIVMPVSIYLLLP